jgi:borealin
MVRTKVNKNQAKRDRNHHNLEGMQHALREFDSEAECMQSSLEREYTAAIDQLSAMFRKLRAKIPKAVLSMKIGDLKATGVNTFKEVEQQLLATTNNNTTSVSRHISNISQSSGYQTETDLTNDIELSANAKQLEPVKTAKNTAGRPLGPLASAIKNRRRSKSVSYTPAQSALLNLNSKKTAHDTTVANRTSRSKYRTPALSRNQAVSADRGCAPITPKVAPNTPLAVFRRARIGETCYSITGSPVIPAPSMDSVANVNIPIGDGMVSIRPTDLGNIDSAAIPKFNPETWSHLKVLQQNLNILMEAAGLGNDHDF